MLRRCAGSSEDPPVGLNTEHIRELTGKTKECLLNTASQDTAAEFLGSTRSNSQCPGCECKSTRNCHPQFPHVRTPQLVHGTHEKLSRPVGLPGESVSGTRVADESVVDEPIERSHFRACVRGERHGLVSETVGAHFIFGAAQR